MTSPQKTKPKNPSTILIVEDDPELADTLDLALQAHGFCSLVARSAGEALALAQERRPDLIVSDVHLADGDGRQLLEMLRSDESLAGRPFVLMTGHPEKAGRRESMDLGADDFLEKPFSAEEFVNCLRARLRRSSILQDSARRMSDQLRLSVTRSLPHELFTPLNGILGFSEVLRQEEFDQGEVREIAETIHQCGERLLRAVRNYLSIVELMQMPKAGAREPEPRVAAAELDRATEAIVRSLAADRERSADLAFVGELGAGESFGVDPECVKVIARELADNALRFSSPGDRVLVRLRRQGGKLALMVTDNGRGLSEERIRQIAAFREFNRSRYSEQGLGLGLTLAQQLLDRQGGSLTIESVVGVGTTACAFWPD